MLLDREGSRPRVWGSNYWSEWIEAVDLYDGDDVDDICVADIDGEFDESEDVDSEMVRFPSCRTSLCDSCFASAGVLPSQRISMSSCCVAFSMRATATFSTTPPRCLL